MSECPNKRALVVMVDNSYTTNDVSLLTGNDVEGALDAVDYDKEEASEKYGICCFSLRFDYKVLFP